MLGAWGWVAQRRWLRAMAALASLSPSRARSVARLSQSCLPLARGNFTFHTAVTEIKPRGDERVAFLLRQTDEFFDLPLMQQQLAGAKTLVVHGVAVREGADVRVEQEAFAVFEQNRRRL